ncbi:MAG: hypothetical protein ABEJ58_05220 [Halodesulfurarchaeum sp.]
MLSRRTALLVTAVLLTALLGAVLTVDFRAMESETDTDASVSTYRVNHAIAPRDGPLTLIVLGDGADAERLATDLSNALKDEQDGWPAVVLAEDGRDTVDGPVLVVSITESLVRYNPVSPSARTRVDFGFVGNGDASFARRFAVGDRPVVIGSETPYVVGGSVAVTDRSRGLVSVPGYRSYLGEMIAEAVSEALTSAPGMSKTG